ncbi:uncharacterized protein LOC101766825 [Setaria italica]|uniref:uncharacterized protein LOC101766825 n=1 Tax=Setaria italica TaxID=4555 RepID=UPI0003509CBF|nr:uncharacterized protein LOC101766825 [Setaria italica]
MPVKGAGSVSGAPRTAASAIAAVRSGVGWCGGTARRAASRLGSLLGAAGAPSPPPSSSCGSGCPLRLKPPAAPSRVPRGRVGSGDGDAQAEDDQSGARLGVQVEGHHQTQEHPRGMIYNMCTQKPPHDYLQQLYEKYRESFEYITSMLAWLLSWGKDIHGNVCLLRIKRWMDRHHTYA